uniref:Caspase domain-containing protein n=1 Tax=Candidatus Kentrum sp. LPFa TaxID=2126335 RepID=A0A450WA15_9GAMM|nr:MAG: Caspase domain-containing protein [Candidatus Kentron sp. LPFa]
MEKHALLIGVSQYSASDLSPLPAAVADARALRRVLRHPKMGGFTDANVTLLENPDRQAMETAIEELFSGRNKDDLALLYFSGHGLKDDAGRLYLATGSTRKHPNGELVRASAVSASAVHENMQRSRARRQVVILDSCYSGAFPDRNIALISGRNGYGKTSFISCIKLLFVGANENMRANA